MLQGLSRVRFSGWEQHDPFRMVRVERLTTIEGNREENRILARQLLLRILEILDDGPQGGKELGAQLATVQEPEVLADFVAANFLPVSDSRQRLLETEEVGLRLKMLLDVLDPS